MTKKLTRVYADYASAQNVVNVLSDAGITDVSLLASNAEGWHRPGHDSVDPKHDKDRDGSDDRAAGAAAGGGLGAMAGAAAGAAAGLGLIAIPGIGPVVAMGWLTTLVGGAIAGGIAGEVIGALAETGTSKENAELYAEALRRGGAIVTVQAAPLEEHKANAILDMGAMDVQARAIFWREKGWRGYDPKAPAYTAEQVAEDRRLHSAPNRPL
jgi:hypothetical protein